VLLSEKNAKATFKEVYQRKMISPNHLEALSSRLKDEGKTLVTLNGSFDLLHPGHLEMIYQASLQGDILILLLNSDESIKENKGKGRPINNLDVRMQNIAALEMVDYVTFFVQSDPRSALETIKPHIHVNGSEYGEDCIEADVVKNYGGKIHIVKLIDGYSSTSLIERIKNSCD